MYGPEKKWQQLRLRARSTKQWLRVKYWFLPNVVILSHYRSGFQWFRQICHANLYRHVTMPPQARYQHYSVERMPPNPKLDRNAILLVRDGRDVMVSLYLTATHDGPGGTRIWNDSDQPITFQEFLRAEFMRVRNWKGEILRLRNPAEYWARFNTDWLESPHLRCVVRYEDLLADQATEIRKIWQSLGYDARRREPLEILLDVDKHSPIGQNLPDGFRRRSTGGWRRIFTDEDLELFASLTGDTMRRLGYGDDLPSPAQAPAPALTARPA